MSSDIPMKLTCERDLIREDGAMSEPSLADKYQELLGASKGMLELLHDINPVHSKHYRFIKVVEAFTLTVQPAQHRPVDNSRSDG